jgi:hypothetical protein
MIDRTAERFDLKSSRLAGDAGYGSGEMVRWLVDLARHRAAREAGGQVRAHGQNLLAQ